MNLAGPRDPRLRDLHGRKGTLLVVDVQNSFADPSTLRSLGVLEVGVEATADAVAGVHRAVAAARTAGVDVVWVRLRVPVDDPWPASNWVHGMAADDPWPSPWEPCVEGTPGIDWFEVEPAAGDLVVDKRTYDGFAGTGLADTLRRNGTEWVAVVGLTSDCCVLETAGSAFTRGFRVVVAADATASHDPGAHEAALFLLSLHSAVVTDVETLRWCWDLQDPAGAAK